MKSLDELRQYAYAHRVPIVADESLKTLLNALKETDSRSVLEIGTAIGYSACAMALSDPSIHIDTIERDEVRYKSALENINALNLRHQIQPVLADALDHTVTRCYDACFIDAAKGQNLSFFRLFFAYTNKIMIIDNTNYHGFVEDDYDIIRSRRLRQMVDRIRAFREYLKTRSDLDVEVLDVADGMILVRRKQSAE